MSFTGLDQIFGKVSADWSAPHSTALEPFLLHVHPLQSDSASLLITVTDFQSNTFQAIKSRLQLEDMRDAVGVGGSWSEFLDYVAASLKSDDVKLLMEGSSESGGALHAKLIAQKSKGMPRVSISLGKLVDGAACKAMESLSRELYSEYKVAHNSLTEEKEQNLRLTNTVADEQEKNKVMQKQLDLMLYSKKHKSHKINDRVGLDNHVMGSQDSPDKLAAHSPSSTKATNRVVPTHRRSKVRGAILKDTEDD
ncbi:uncharacterized protein LOC142536885 [Primulina tabacum]|uniref:uncharacterized protein LOC142536885 n=1 Tax=Primulina tabacum TaxID=48773 RepID=UPI003F590A32